VTGEPNNLLVLDVKHIAHVGNSGRSYRGTNVSGSYPGAGQIVGSIPRCWKTTDKEVECMKWKTDAGAQIVELALWTSSRIGGAGALVTVVKLKVESKLARKRWRYEKIDVTGNIFGQEQQLVTPESTPCRRGRRYCGNPTDTFSLPNVSRFPMGVRRTQPNRTVGPGTDPTSAPLFRTIQKC